MSKKIIALVALTIFILGLSSCTMAGAELALMGKWKGSYQYTQTTTPPEGAATTITTTITQEWEFNNNDTYKLTHTTTGEYSGLKMVDVMNQTGKIVKVEIKDKKKLILQIDGSSAETHLYYTLNGNKLTVTNGDLTIEMDKQ